jgi:glutamine---fructose-6-phosphate transaminase (isomerizing)
MTIMMEEIVQQPSALAGLRKYYESPGTISRQSLHQMARWPPNIIFTGMGSSLFAAYPAQAYLTSHGIRATVWEAAELLHYHLGILKPDTLVVAVSQSGETVEVLRLLEQIPEKVGVAAVVNVERSTLARRGGLLLPMMAGRQTNVSTKTYICSVAVLMYLAFAIADEPRRHLTHVLLQAIRAQERILDQYELLMAPTVEFFDYPPYVALLSRGPDLASVHQGAMMLKEVARLGAEPISAAQFRHGPIEIVSPNHRYVVFARQAQPGPRRRGAADTGRLLLKLAKDIQLHGGRVLLLTNLASPETTNIRTIRVEPLKLGLGTLIDTLYMQLLAHDLAVRAGLEPGKTRIAEGVTRVE